MLLGHKMGIASGYYRPTEEDMQLQAEKLIDALTIEPSQRLQRKGRITYNGKIKSR